jgi:hypothetical protein
MDFFVQKLRLSLRASRSSFICAVPLNLARGMTFFLYSGMRRSKGYTTGMKNTGQSAEAISNPYRNARDMY